MKKLRYRLILALFATSLTCILLISVLGVAYIIQKNEEDIQTYRKTLYEQFDYNIKSEVQTAHSLIQNIYEQQKKGVLTEIQAKKQAADLIRGLRFDNNNYFWVDTVDGINIVLQGRATEGKSRINAVDPNGNYYIRDIIKVSLQPEGGFIDFLSTKPNETEPLPKRGYALSFKPYNWVIGTGNWVDHIEKEVVIKKEEYRKELQVNIFVACMVALLGIAIAIGIALYISRKIANPIVEVVGGMELIAAGDLSMEDLSVKSQDEVGQLSNSVNKMKENLHHLIREIAGSSCQVAAASEELTASAEQAALCATTVAGSVSGVARGAEEQLLAVSAASQIIEKMSEEIQQVAAGSKQVADQSFQATMKAEAGTNSVNKAVKQMALIEYTVNSSAELVVKLGERSSEIGQIVSVISGIAKQTNLLALNAAIEAARAGEQGRGFAVVADEVRRLAEQSHDAAQKITELIGEVQADTSNAVKAMNKGTSEVKVGADVVDIAGDSFVEIAAIVSAVSEKVEEISVVMQQLAEGGQQIVVSMCEAGRLSKVTMGESKKVSDAMAGQDMSMREIVSSSQAMANLAQELQKAASNFRM